MRRGLVGGIAVTALAAGLVEVPAAAGDTPTIDRCTSTSIAPAVSGWYGRDGVDVAADGSVVGFISDRDLTGANPDGSEEVFVYDIATASLTQVPSPSDRSVHSVAVSSGGRRVVFSRGYSFSTRGGTVTVSQVLSHDRATGITSALTDGYNGSYGGLRVTPDGTQVAFAGADFSSGDGGIFLSDGTTSGDRVVTSWGAGSVSILPDGRRLLFASDDDLTGQNSLHEDQVFLYDPSAPEQPFRQVTQGSLGSWNPHLLADGHRFTYDSVEDVDGLNPRHRYTTYVHDLDTGSTVLRSSIGPAGILSDDASHVIVRTSADLVGTNPTGDIELFSHDVARGTVTPLTSAAHESPRVEDLSADGSVIAVSDDLDSFGVRYELSVLTTCDPAPRADAQVATAASRRFVGDDVYAVNPTAAQKASAPIAAGGSRSFLVRLQNDRTAVDSVTVAGRDAGRPGYAVRYKHLGVDVTAEVEAGTFTVGPLDPGASAVLQVKVTADPGVPAGARHRVDVTARSVANPVAGDTVRARVTASR